MSLSLLVALGACAILLLATLGGLVAARGARAECRRLGAESEERLREAAAARAEAQVARAEGQGRAGLLADREARLAEVAAEAGTLRRAHAEAESRCAKATEAVALLREVEGRLREDVDRHAGLLREEQALHARLRADHAALRADADGRLASAAREVEALKAIREEMTREFRDLANRTLRETGAQFSDAHHQKLTELLTPFREQVNRFESELREVHKSAGVDRAVLHEQIRALTTQTQAVSQEAVNLTRALKGEKQRQGAWGENQLEQYLIHMGYQKDVHYFTQATRTDEAGERWRPDVILRMPGGKSLVIDSKVSLVAYAAAIDAATEEERAPHLRRHVLAVKDHIDTLAAKGYHALEHGAVEWVMLFMPIEGAVSAAWSHEADIGTYAMERGIGLAYPTNLMMALKTVRQLWDIETRNANAERIAQRGGLIYDKLAGFIESFGVMERALDAAKAAQVKALGQLTEGKGNLVSQVEQLKKLGAKTSKSLALAFDAEPEGDAPGAVPAGGDARALPAAE